MDKKITNKRIINFMIKKNKYWEPIKFGKRIFIMTFEYNVYERIL